MRAAHRNSRRRGGRRLGQALVETAIAAPVLVLLLLGGAQVGSIAYAQVSLDTAAREGARAGTAVPSTAVQTFPSQGYWYPGQSTYTCQSADFTGSPANPICAGVYNSAGLLDQTKFTSGAATVTITVVPPAGSPGGLASYTGRPGNAQLAASKSCSPGSTATLQGNVTFPAGQTQAMLSDNASPTPDTKLIDSSSSTYIFCVTTNSHGTQPTITAVSPPTPNCGGYTWSVTLPVTYPGQTFTYDINFSAEPSCPTQTTTSTTTSTSTTSSSTSTSTGTSSSTSTTSLSISSNAACDVIQVPDQYYFRVTVSYPAPIFVPFINQLFQTSQGIRTITTSVTYPIEPCTMTNPKIPGS